MDFSFKKILSKLDTLSKPPPSVLGVDIGSSSVKMVQIKKEKGRAILETYGELSLSTYANKEVGRATNLPPEKIVEAINDLIKEANITTRNAAVAIPVSASLISLMELPDLGEKRLAEMVPIEARRHIPVSISEVTLDWWVAPKSSGDNFVTPEEGAEDKEDKHDENSGKKVEVILVAILNESLNRFRGITDSAAFEKTLFEIEIFGSVRSSLDEGIEPVAILDMGAGSTKLYVVEKGIVKDSHTIARGSQDVTLAISRALNLTLEKAEEIKRSVGISTDPSNRQISEIISLVMDNIYSEVNKSILVFEKRSNKPVSKIVLAGGGALMPGFAESSKVHFNTEVVLADPFSKLVTPAFMENLLKIVGPEFAVAVGVALRKLSDQG